ncbi:uncharacterized protein [Eurosta solidaginis]
MANARQPPQALGKRTFWTEFFALYESLPALWDMNDPLYKDRQCKTQGYEVLITKMREIDPYACREDVLRKINIFRTNYRRECARIKASNRMGKRYTTSLWYFKMLNFLQNQDPRKDRKRVQYDEKKILRRVGNKIQPTQSIVPACSVKSHVSSTHNTQEISIEYNKNEPTKYEYISDKGNDSEEHLEEAQYADERSFQQQFHNQFHTFTFLPRPQQMQANGTKPPMEDLEADVGEYQEIVHIEDSMQSQDQIIEELERLETDDKDALNVNTDSTPTEDNTAQQITTRKTSTKTPVVQQVNATNSPAISEASEILAKSWAIQYEEMSMEQRIYARKAIAEILFEGCLGNLGRKSNIMRNASTADAVVSSQFEHVEMEEENSNTEQVTEENSIIQLDDDNHTYIYAGRRSVGAAAMQLKEYMN